MMKIGFNPKIYILTTIIVGLVSIYILSNLTSVISILSIAIMVTLILTSMSFTIFYRQRKNDEKI